MENRDYVSMKEVNVQDNFFGFYQRLVKEKILPYQWNALNDRIEDADKSYAIQNFKIAAGLEKGEFGGCVFQDSDVAKWLEASAYSLIAYPDKELEKTMDETIELIGKAQKENGYLDTYFSIKEPGNEWTNLKDRHELYCAGHMIEAAVAYYEVTGKRRLLDIMCKCADHIDSVLGPEEGKIHGYPGHPEIELALVRLYEATGEKRYLKLSEYFLLERGQEPNYYQQVRKKRDGKQYTEEELQYCQADRPVLKQRETEGHAVRANYMYTGMAGVALKTQNEELLEACRDIWDNIQKKKLYINGGVGASPWGEAYAGNYDLPNDMMYTETCASIALVYFAKRMLQTEKNAKYADVIERVLYNLVPGSISLQGNAFFYVNPLEVNPYEIDHNGIMRHVKYVRQKWFGCACCPPNAARLLASAGAYIYTKDENGISVDLYAGNETTTQIKGKDTTISIETNMPYGGENTIRIASAEDNFFTLSLRIPQWAKTYQILVDGEMISTSKPENGYLEIARNWKGTHSVSITFEMEPLAVRTNPLVPDNIGKVAVQRGPIVYCMEEADNEKGLSRLTIDAASLQAEPGELLGHSIVRIKAKAQKLQPVKSDTLYLFNEETVQYEPCTVTFIPYYMWQNRGVGEMQIWSREWTEK